MDNKNNNLSTSSGQGNNFFSGLLLGILVGGVLVFLLGTERGKKILKTISEKGLGDISNILDDEDKSVVPDEAIKKPRKQNIQTREFAVKEEPIEEKPRVRRFFRGISRRVN